MLIYIAPVSLDVPA